MPQAFDHLVEGARQPSDLVAGTDGQRHTEVARLDARGGLGKGRDWTCHPTGDDHSEDQRGQGSQKRGANDGVSHRGEPHQIDRHRIVHVQHGDGRPRPVPDGRERGDPRPALVMVDGRVRGDVIVERAPEWFQESRDQRVGFPRHARAPARDHEARLPFLGIVVGEGVHGRLDPVFILHDRKRLAHPEVRARLLGQRPLDHHVQVGIDQVRPRARDVEQQGPECRLRLTLLALVQHLADEADSKQRDGDEEPGNADAEALPGAERGELGDGCRCHGRHDSPRALMRVRQGRVRLPYFFTPPGFAAPRGPYPAPATTPRLKSDALARLGAHGPTEHPISAQ